jgi:hypothetical protein
MDLTIQRRRHEAAGRNDAYSEGRTYYRGYIRESHQKQRPSRSYSLYRECKRGRASRLDGSAENTPLLYKESVFLKAIQGADGPAYDRSIYQLVDSVHRLLLAILRLSYL